MFPLWCTIVCKASSVIFLEYNYTQLTATWWPNCFIKAYQTVNAKVFYCRCQFCSALMQVSHSSYVGSTPLPCPPGACTFSQHTKNYAYFHCLLVKEGLIKLWAHRLIITMGSCNTSVLKQSSCLISERTTACMCLSFGGNSSLKCSASSAWRFLKCFSWSQVKTFQWNSEFRDLFLQWGGSRCQLTESTSLVTLLRHEGSRYVIYLT